jgi:hypothetical protein
MKKNNLVPNKGLSLSTAQSISNLCNQRANEIAGKLIPINNYSKSMTIITNGVAKELVTVTGHKMPVNIVDLIKEKAELHACQAFLMENLKAKEALLQSAKAISADVSAVEIPVRPEFKMVHNIPVVTENFGWDVLTAAELCEYYEAEAYAAHIGQFIHDKSILAALRNELPNIPTIEWFNIKDGEKSPVTINIHHTSEQLQEIHEKLAALHRQYEQRVNYFKAKVKNLTTEENARIAKLNADAQSEVLKANADLQVAYDSAMNTFHENVRSIKANFEKERQASIKEIASMRINVDPRFQKIVDMFLNQLPSSQD